MFEEFDKSENNKIRPINSPQRNLSLQSSHIHPTECSDGRNRWSNSSSSTSTNDETLNNLTKLDISSSDIETTKSELIKCILDSFKSKPSSDSSPCQLIDISNKIYIHFNDKNELGTKPHIDDLLEQIEYTKKCSCHRIEIIFDNYILNQQLSYKQKQSILRLILRRQQIYNRFFSHFNLLTQSNIEK